MGRAALAFLLGLTLLASAARADDTRRDDVLQPFIDAQDFLNWLERQPQRPGRSASAFHVYFSCNEPAPGVRLEPTCHDTIGAVLDTLDAIEAWRPLARVYCPPVRPVPVEDARRIVRAWGDRNPDAVIGPAGEATPGAWVVVKALVSPFPCPERGM